MSGLSAWIFLSVWMAKSHKKVAFLFAMTFGGLCSHQFLSCGWQKFWHKHQWMYWPNLSCQFWYSAVARMGQPDTRWSMVSMCLSNTLHFGLAPFSNMLAWKFLVGRLWSCTAMMKYSVSDFRSDEDILMGQWRIYIRISSTNWYLPWRDLSFHLSFSSLIFLVLACVLICFAFSADLEFSEMLSVLKLISFKYFFASQVIEYTRLFFSCVAYPLPCEEGTIYLHQIWGDAFDALLKVYEF